MAKFITYRGTLVTNDDEESDNNRYTRTVLLENIGLEVMVSEVSEVIEVNDEVNTKWEETSYFLEDYNDRVRSQRFLIDKSEYERIFNLINEFYGMEKGRVIGEF